MTTKERECVCVYTRACGCVCVCVKNLAGVTTLLQRDSPIESLQNSLLYDKNIPP